MPKIPNQAMSYTMIDYKNKTYTLKKKCAKGGYSSHCNVLNNKR